MKLKTLIAEMTFFNCFGLCIFKQEINNFNMRLTVLSAGAGTEGKSSDSVIHKIVIFIYYYKTSL